MNSPASTNGWVCAPIFTGSAPRGQFPRRSQRPGLRISLIHLTLSTTVPRQPQVPRPSEHVDVIHATPVSSGRSSHQPNTMYAVSVKAAGILFVIWDSHGIEIDCAVQGDLPVAGRLKIESAIRGRDGDAVALLPSKPHLVWSNRRCSDGDVATGTGIGRQIRLPETPYIGTGKTVPR